MVYLKDIKFTNNKRRLAFGFLFGILGIVSPLVPVYGIYAAVLFFVVSSVFFVKAPMTQKFFGADLQDTVHMSDSVNVVKMNKDGTIIETRQN